MDDAVGTEVGARSVVVAEFAIVPREDTLLILDFLLALILVEGICRLSGNLILEVSCVPDTRRAATATIAADLLILGGRRAATTLSSTTATNLLPLLLLHKLEKVVLSLPLGKLGNRGGEILVFGVVTVLGLGAGRIDNEILDGLQRRVGAT